MSDAGRQFGWAMMFLLLAGAVFFTADACGSGYCSAAWFDRHDKLASWVQAVGSIAAILVSAGFAIWVPIHQGALEEQRRVQRAVNSIVVMQGLSASAWRMVEKTLALGQWSTGTTPLIADQIKAARAIADHVPPSMFLGTAFVIIHTNRLSLSTLEQALQVIDEAMVPELAISRELLQSQIDELHSLDRAVESLVPKCVRGMWMIAGCDDDEIHR